MSRNRRKGSNSTQKSGARPTVAPHAVVEATAQPEDDGALRLHLDNLLLNLIALLLYFLVQHFYVSPTSNPSIEIIRQNLLPIAVFLALGKPLLTAALGSPHSSWSIAEQRIFAVVRVLLSIALIAVLVVVPVYASGFPAYLSSLYPRLLGEVGRYTFENVVSWIIGGLIGWIVKALLSWIVKALLDRLVRLMPGKPTQRRNAK